MGVLYGYLEFTSDFTRFPLVRLEGGLRGALQAYRYATTT